MANGTPKTRTRRERFGKDFSDKTLPTSLDWPADVYVFVKRLAAKRNTSMNAITVEALVGYLKEQPETRELLEDPEDADEEDENE